MHSTTGVTATLPKDAGRISKPNMSVSEPSVHTSSVRLSPKAQRISPEPIIAYGSVEGYGAVFNAGVIEHEGTYHLFARGIRDGYRRNQGEGARFLDYVSDVLVFTSSNGVNYQFQQVLARSSDEWIHAVEDPRVQWVTSGGTAHAVMTYTNLPHPSTGEPWRVGAHRLTFDGQQFALDHASGRVLGAVGVHDKDAVVFNLRSGRVALIHRVHPNIQVAVFDDLEHLWSADETYWDAHMRDLDQHTIIASSVRVSGVGAGAPPVPTDEGLLLFYHERLTTGTYTMNVALLDHDTGRVLSVLPEPILVPELPWELVGDVDDVVFVGGAVARPDGTIYLTYGAADRCVGAAVISTAELLGSLREVASPNGLVG
jgi:beta-1,2-mannobiose phosphorylase / 1,2-beta-oligomannan phosphorylase